MLNRLLERARCETLWALVQDCGSAGELERVRAYLEHNAPDPPCGNRDQNSPWGYFPGLQSRPWHDPATAENCESLQKQFDTIIGELQTVKALQAATAHYAPSLVKGGEWTAFYLQLAGRIWPLARELCPVTTQLSSSLPCSAGRAFLSALSPGGRILPHNDATNTRLRLHLGLDIPDRCSIRVADEWRSWSQGGFLHFDGTYNHEVRNAGARTRWVLIIDVWHPELTAPERLALQRLGHWRRRERRLRHREGTSARRIARQIRTHRCSGPA